MSALLAICVAALTGCTGGGLPETLVTTSPFPIASPSSIPTAEATITATIDWFPATATPTQLPTQAVEPTAEMRPGVGNVLLQDDFSQEGDWQTLHTSSGSVAYGNGVLTLAISSGKAALTSFRQQPGFSNFDLEITAAPSLCRGSDNYGLLLRASPSTTAPDFFRWILTCDGNMRLERLKGGQIAVLQDWTSRVARPDAARLGVWAHGSEMRFFIEGVHQFTIRDPSLPSGVIGVFARSGGENALTVNFSDLVVREIVD